jgi:hypothetical protein
VAGIPDEANMQYSEKVEKYIEGLEPDLPAHAINMFQDVPRLQQLRSALVNNIGHLVEAAGCRNARDIIGLVESKEDELNKAQARFLQVFEVLVGQCMGTNSQGEPDLQEIMVAMRVTQPVAQDMEEGLHFFLGGT